MQTLDSVVRMAVSAISRGASARLAPMAWLLLAGTSCGAVDIPRVNSTKLVAIDVMTQDEIPSHDKYWRPGTITQPLMRATFSTTDDLQALAVKWKYGVDNIVALCEKPSIELTKVSSGFPDVLDWGGPIGPDRPPQMPTSKSANAKLATYYIYFDLRQSRRRDRTPYDLVSDPHNVCFRIRGGDEELGIGFNTNIVLIP